MTDDTHSANSEERRASVNRRVERAECLHHPVHVHVGIALEEVEDHRNHAFIELEHYVADESIAHHDVDWTTITCGGRKIATFHVSLEVESRGAKKSVRFLRDRVAFGLFLTDVEKSNDRILSAENRFSVHRAEPGELYELLWRAVHVCAGIQKHDGLPGRRQNRRHWRALEPRMQAEHDG